MNTTINLIKQLKWSLLKLKTIHLLNFLNKLMIKILNLKYKIQNIFAKGCTPNWSEETFVIKEVKNTIPWTYFINDLNCEEIIGTFYEKELQKKKLTRI